MTFLDGSQVLGTKALSNGTAQLPTSTLSVGAHKLAADYGGDGTNFLGSSSLVSPTALVPVVAGNLFFGDGAPAVNALFNNPTAVALNLTTGDLYITDTSHEVVREVSAANGTISVAAGKYLNGGDSGDGGAPTSAQVFVPQGVAVDSSGDIFIADTGNNVVREIKNGNISTVATGLNGPMGLAVDSAGNLFIADSGDDVVRKLSTTGVLSVVAGTLGTAGSTGDGGSPTAAKLNNPTALAVSAAGNLFIADTGNNVVREVSGGVITTVATGLSGPTGVAVAPAGNLFVSDTGNNVVKRFVSGTPTTVATGLNAPGRLAADTSGDIFIADTGDNVIRELKGGNVTIVAGSTNPGYAGNNGPATSAELVQPTGLATDTAGDLFIVDSADNVIREVTSGGTISTVAGTGTAGFNGNLSPPTSFNLYAPQAVAVDAAGDIFIAEENNDVIRKVTPAGAISIVAGMVGQFGSTGDGGAATSAKLQNPSAVAVDAAGDLFIADMGNNEIREVTPDGKISNFAGGQVGATHAVTLNDPQGVAVDSSGDVFIADTGDHRVVEVKTDGTVAVVAGTGTAGNTGDGGAATSAELTSPMAVTVDPFGDLIIADNGAAAVRLVTPTGIISTLVSGAVTGTGGNPIALQAEGVAADAAGDVFVSDFFSSVARKVSLQPLTVTVSASGPAATTTIAGPATFTPGRGQALTIYAVVSVTPPGVGPPTGTVTFKYLGTFVLATPR